VLWSIVLWLFKALVVVWALQLVVFALGVSLMSKRQRPSDQAVAEKREGEAITQHALELPVAEPAA